VPREIRDVVFVDGVRTPFGKANGQYAETRADDLVIKCIRELLRRNPSLPPEKVDEVAIAATTQIGDQGLTIGRTAALLAGLPSTTPGYAIDRMCAGAMTAVTTTAAGIAFGAYDVVVAGGVEHMGRHPMGEGVDPNPRIISEKLVDTSALVMGSTAENLHDRFPTITKQRADAFAVASQERAAKAYANDLIQPDLVPIATRSAENGWGYATTDEPMRQGTTMEDLAKLKTPFRPHGRVSAGNSAGINDGATACVLASAEAAVRALGRAARYRDWRDAEATATAEPAPAQPALDPEVRRVARRLVEQSDGAWVGHAGSAALLKLCGVDVLGEVATGLDAAVTSAARCGYPIAVKAAEGVVHRTERRLVRTNIASATELAEILRQWESEPEGRTVVVQPMRAGTEIALGIVRDPVLGPLVMVAAGGTTVDVWDDRALLVPPITPRDAARAVRGLRAWRLLRGHRGASAGDVAGLEAMIVALSQLALAVPEVAELDLNPVLVAPDGCAAVDVKLRLVQSSDPTNPAPRQLRPVPR